MLQLLFLVHGVNVTEFVPPEQLDVGINLSPLATDGDGVAECMLRQPN